MKKRKALTLFIAAAMAFMLLACCCISESAAADGRVYRMRMGAISSPPTPEAVFIEELVDFIHEATGGRIVAEAYHSGTIGNNTQMISGLQDGSVHAVAIPINQYESYVPELGVLGLPMFFRDAEQAYQLCKTPGNGFHEMLEEAMQARGFMIGTWGISAGSTLISTRPVAQFEDFNGLKVWCLPNARIVDTMNALGAVPVNFSTGDLALAVQQRTVDAAYTGVQLLAPQMLHETAKHLFVLSTPMNFNVQALVLSKVFMESLPEDLRETLQEALLRAGTDIHYPLAIQAIEDSMNVLKNADGMTVVYSDEVFTERAREAFAPIAEIFITAVPSALPLYERAVELIAAEGP
ncbi:MAG: TRAP transporter substrate-binding protein [Synergistaceae bacterium]|nr:TRAP transporter substrate-binding protein [Synergistaceae bacterium]